MKKFSHILKFGSALAVALAMFGTASIMSACRLATTLEPCETEAILNFTYRFTLDDNEGRPDPETPALADLVDVIELYTFDKNAGDVLVDITSVRKSDIVSGNLPITILSGDYTMVAWGLGQHSANGGGFANVQMVDPETNYYTPVVINKTRLEDFRTLVIQPQDQSFADLYYAIAENVHVPIPTTASSLVETEFNFTPYSNVIRLTINGMDDVREHIAAMRARSTRGAFTTRADESADFPLDIYLTGKNGIFAYDGSIDDRAVELTYNDAPVSSSETQAVVEIKTLRVDVNRHSVDPMILHIHAAGAVTDEEMHVVTSDINLLTLIKQVKDSAGNLILDTQDEIDRAAEIPIELTIERVPVDDNPDPTPDPDPAPDPDKEYRLQVKISVVGWVIDDVNDVEIIVVTR